MRADPEGERGRAGRPRLDLPVRVRSELIPRQESAPKQDRDRLARRVAREVKVHSLAHRALRNARSATRGSTVIVGPWCSEVGFELLYWIPFARRMLDAHGVPPERVVVVSRGGARDWYGDMAGQYADVLDWYSAERFYDEQRRRIAGGTEKQFSYTPFDHELLARVRERYEAPRARVLHPSTMYRRYRAVWMRRRALSLIEREVDFLPIAAEPRPPAGLSEGEYIAVKAYFSGSFPDTGENRAALRMLLERLASKAPVVLLDGGGVIDDHDHPELTGLDLTAGVLSGRPATSLAEQTAIVRGARMLVSTYGGFSYLGPFLGVPTCAYYASDFNRIHLELLRSAEHTLEANRPAGTGTSGYLLFDIRQLALIDELAGQPSPAPVRP